jgi:hypothetical protein
MKRLTPMLILLIGLYGCVKSDDGTVEVVPLPPTELKATLASKEQVDLSWKDNSTNETGYKIERKTDTGNFTEIGSTATDITTFSDKSLSLNTNYTYRVYSFNQVGKSISYSNEVAIRTFNAPALTTTAITEITASGAKSGGTVSSDGGSGITTRGVVWGTSTNPTISLTTKTSDGTGVGAFQSAISGLAASTKYFVRAYATNSVGTSYGNELSFTTIQVGLPTLTTTQANTVGSSTAKSGVSVTNNGGTTITETGLCWSTSSNPTISLTTKKSGETPIVIKGLFPNTKYYVRAYAITNIGTAYGNQIDFTTTTDADITTGLVAYYPFNGNANDLSGKNNNGTVSGATLASDRFGVANKAYSFNGISNYISVPHNSSLSASNTQLTISAWVKVNQFTGSPNKAACILEKASGTSGDWGLLYQDFDANNSIEKLRFGGYTWYSNTVLMQGLYTATVPPTNQWVHIVYTVDGTSGTNYYINGENESDIGNGGNNWVLSPNTSPLYIGKSGTIGGKFIYITGSNYNYFNGAIDDIRIFNKVLNEDQIQYLYLH